MHRHVKWLLIVMYLLPFCYLFSGVLYPFFKTSFVPFQEECSLYHFILAFLLVYFVVTQSLKLLQRFRRSPSLSPSNVGGFMFSWAMKWSYNILATFISFIHFSCWAFKLCFSGCVSICVCCVRVCVYRCQHINVVLYTQYTFALLIYLLVSFLTFSSWIAGLLYGIIFLLLKENPFIFFSWALAGG